MLITSAPRPSVIFHMIVQRLVVLLTFVCALLAGDILELRPSA